MSASVRQVHVHVDAGASQGALEPFWNYIGYDEINYTYVPEGQALLAKFRDLKRQPFYIRAHHLLCSGNCHASYKWGSTNVYREDEQGSPIYDWTIIDLVFDTILQYNAKPFVELGFMPQDLADPGCYDAANENWTGQLYRSVGWACPPKDYKKWHDLIYALVRHCLERYGHAEITTWYWELWNEPDIIYWRGTRDEFLRLYDYTAAAVKAGCPEARVGGPATTNPAPDSQAAAYLDAFLNHCANGVNTFTGQQGTPLDFITFHVKGGGYRADPKRRIQDPPSVKQILAHTRNGYALISKYPQYKALKCVLSEIDPDGWAAGGVWDNVNLNFRNTEYYPSFVASAFEQVRRFAKNQSWSVKMLSWAFLFVGERCFEGTRAFSTQGIDKVILNLYRMYARLGTQEILFESSGSKDPMTYAELHGRGEEPDISGLATTSDAGLQVFIYNHHDDWDIAQAYEIELEVVNLPFAGAAVVNHYRLDASHSNAYAEWIKQGKPMYLAAEQRAAIQAREGLELLEPPQLLTPRDAKLTLKFTLPVHAISLLKISSPSAIK